MKIQTQTHSDSSNIFLTGAILLANLEYESLADYALKAVVGGLIWMAFKVGAEIAIQKIKEYKNKFNSKDE